jgi:hypothetical protein
MLPWPVASAHHWFLTHMRAACSPLCAAVSVRAASIQWDEWIREDSERLQPPGSLAEEETGPAEEENRRTKKKKKTTR